MKNSDRKIKIADTKYAVEESIASSKQDRSWECKRRHEVIATWEEIIDYSKRNYNSPIGNFIQ